ncbi:flavodoxin family protein [Breznakia pachnodae]|uniref:Multimeric flavodoxin WrbA n=1 Tax=Breznakia pachnodae TaxID=265178 RepID=A0ABU0E2T0_9FIRM|nr:flavodoxin family protein [Breznakia pachnodae]MDQ0361054.1 multimeric flavodoxin WrbA [Breznakia pachnodae]
MRKIVVLSGSPRRNGNSEKLADAFIRGAESAGHQVKKMSVIDYPVKGCLGCDYCMRNNGECIQKDGMQAIFEELYQADMVVFATPVYYWNMTSQLKAVVDRLYASIAKPLPITSSALLASLGGNVQEDGKLTVDNYNIITNYMKLKDEGVIIADKVMNKNEIDGNPILEEAEMLGRSLK